MIALSTGSLYSYGTARVFELAKEAGFGGLELVVDSRWDSRQPAYLTRLMDEFSLPIVSLHNSFHAGVPGWPADGITSATECVKLAEAVGAGVVVLHLPARLGFLEVHWGGARRRQSALPYLSRAQRAYLAWLKDGLHELQATTRVIIAVENLSYTYPLFGLLKSAYYMNTPDEWARLDHWAMDTTHLGTAGMDILAVYERLKGRLAHVHLSNFNGKEHRPLTDGHLPLAGLLQRLRRDQYKGAVVCEMDPDPLGASDENVVRENLRATVGFCREHFGEETT